MSGFYFFLFPTRKLKVRCRYIVTAVHIESLHRSKKRKAKKKKNEDRDEIICQKYITSMYLLGILIGICGCIGGQSVTSCGDSSQTHTEVAFRLRYVLLLLCTSQLFFGYHVLRYLFIGWYTFLHILYVSCIIIHVLLYRVIV